MSSGEASSDALEEHPEIYLAGAFASGLALAIILRILGRDD